MPSRIEILNYRPEWQLYFERFNKAWLEEYFSVEPIDRWVLENPEEVILDKGGKVFFARYEGRIIGTVALMPRQDGTIELTKMAVDKPFRGLGAGKLLCQAAISEARESTASHLILYSQTRLSAAIGLYRKLGFREIPLEPGTYERANIKMELPLHVPVCQSGSN